MLHNTENIEEARKQYCSSSPVIIEKMNTFSQSTIQSLLMEVKIGAQTVFEHHAQEAEDSQPPMEQHYTPEMA